MHNGSYIRIGDSDEPMTEYEIYSLQSYKDDIQEDLRPVKLRMKTKKICRTKKLY